MNYIVATVKSWNIDNFNKLKSSDKENNWFLITDKNDLVFEKIKEINPGYVFFPHWSWIIPQNIFVNFECVVFHMTDLPYGRGGSPLQNLIVCGHKNTKISAIKVAEGIDTGDIYMKEDVTLEGKAEEIFRRCSTVIFTKMIPNMIKNNPIPKPQNGEVTEFKRRKPADGNIAQLDSIEKVYDCIRMLDAEGYPRAYLETDSIKLEFEDAVLDELGITVKVKIKKK